MKGAIILSLVATCLAVGALGDTCARKGDTRVDGCSIPGDLPFFFKSTFAPDCNQHDICYICGAARGISRKQCDDKFWKDLKRRCQSVLFKRAAGDKRREFCEKVSLSYYFAVRIGGGQYFANPNVPDYCKESWVKQCIP